MANKKLWDKGYSIDKEVEDFTVGDDYILDLQLVKYDCLASIAHAKTLGKAKILKPDEVSKLTKQFNAIIELSEQGKFKISKQDEDAHTAIENMLTQKLGDLGKKIHTGRSRNDQVLTALRLYYKDHLQLMMELSEKFIEELGVFSSKYAKIEMPGYTHTRKAMPSSVAMWSDAFIESMQDNITLLETAFLLVDQSPLGTGAGYGTNLGLDRKYSAEQLGFEKVQESPIYTQMSRGKFESTMLHAMTQIMFDINKMASDLILFSMPEFGYFVLPDKFTTGSSMMPQKKNPDVLELLRAKYHVVLSYEMQVKGVSTNLISGYNRDLQVTKKPTMEGLQVTEQCLKMVTHLFNGLKVDAAACKKGLTSEVYATHMAYELVKKGMPFRDAYKEISKKFSSKK